jgi:TRAP-type C4-dicarboxylate transport system permease small subunit
LTVNKIVQQWNRLETFLFGLLVLGALGCAVYGIIMRYFFQSPPPWNEEVSQYFVIWAVFLAASTLAEERGHVGATLIVEHLPTRMRRGAAVFNATAALVFCGIISWYAFQIVWHTYLTDERSPTDLRFPLWIAYLSVAAGCFLVGVRSVMRIYRLLFHFTVSDILEHHEMSREKRDQL